MSNKPAPKPLDTIAARCGRRQLLAKSALSSRKAAEGLSSVASTTTAQRLLAAGYDEPCLKMIVEGELS